MSKQDGGSWMTIAAVIGALAALITAIFTIPGLTGDDDADGPGPTPTRTGEPPQAGPTLAQWVRDADPICSQGAAELAAANQQITPEAPLAQQVAGFRAIAVAIQRRNDRLRELASPADAEQEIGRMILLSDDVGSELANAAGAAERGDQATLLAAADRALRQAERETEIASRLGVPRCRLEVAPAPGSG